MKSRRGNATVLSGMPPGGANQGACLAVPALQVQTLAVGGGDWERLRAVQAAHDCADAKQGTKAKDKERSSNRARSTTDSFGAPLRSGQSYLFSLGRRVIRYLLHDCANLAITKPTLSIQPSEHSLDIMTVTAQPRLGESTCVVATRCWKLNVQHVEHRLKFGNR